MCLVLLVDPGVLCHVLSPSLQLSYPRAASEDGDDEGNVSRALFKRAARYPETKIFSFNKLTQDFDFQIDYGDLSFLPPAQLEYVVSVSPAPALLLRRKSKPTYRRPSKLPFVWFGSFSSIRT